VFILVKIASLIMFSPFFLFSTRVSNELGARNPQAARVAVFAVLFLAIIEMSIVSTILLATRRVFCYTFSNEKEVVDYVTTMTPLVCLSVILDSIQGVFSGRKFLFSVLSIVY
jgi:MATE family multidrug resistance protein